MPKLRIAVLFGGRSGEHEVSIRSAASVIAALDRARYQVVPVGVAPDGRPLPPAASAAMLPAEARADLKLDEEVVLALDPSRTAGADVVCPVLHGTFGEDGTIQGLLELADVAYVGSGVLGSACGMDKDVMKRLFRAAGLPSVEHLRLRRDERAAAREAIERRFGYPVFVKPANLGSSVGISKASDADELRAALETAAAFDRKIVVEPAIDGREIECAVLEDDAVRASLPGEIIPTHGFYDYEAKYVDDSARLEIPAQLDPEQVKEVQRLSIAAFEACECAGLARVDFFLERSSGRLLLNEINTMPGFTSISMYPKLWEASGLPYPRLLDRLIESALRRRREKESTRFDRRGPGGLE